MHTLGLFFGLKYTKHMDLREISEDQKILYNKIVGHIMQSWEWGELRASLGTPTIRFGLYKDGKLNEAFQVILHKLPLTHSYVGYIPKGPFPNKEQAQALREIGKKYHCIVIKVEPNVLINKNENKVEKEFSKSTHSLFTKHNFLIDLTHSEEQILQNMHQKFRYNIKIAQKHNVWVEDRTDNEALEIYLKLYFSTTKRQAYHGHNEDYHRRVWQALKGAGMARLMIAFYQPEGEKTPIPLTAWMVFKFKDTFYYPYGGSSDKYRNVMASNLVAWEVIRLGKKLGCKLLDLWGALGPAAPENHPWQGFTRFKAQTGAERVEYLGTYDLILNPWLYYPFALIDTFMPLKIFMLKLVRRD